MDKQAYNEGFNSVIEKSAARGDQLAKLLAYKPKSFAFRESIPAAQAAIKEHVSNYGRSAIDQPLASAAARRLGVQNSLHIPDSGLSASDAGVKPTVTAPYYPASSRAIADKGIIDNSRWLRAARKIDPKDALVDRSHDRVRDRILGKSLLDRLLG